MPTVKVAIIITTWNSEQDIGQCIDSIHKSFTDLDYTIVIVDNASSDHTIEIVEKINSHDQIIFIKNSDNLGLSKANNTGIKATEAEYYMILNPDTQLNPEAVSKMVGYMDLNPEVGAVGPEQWDEDHKIRPTLSHKSYKLLTQLYIEKLLGLFSSKHKLIFKGRYNVNLINGGCMLLRGKMMKEVGLFNENLFIYGEEYDYFPRVRKDGWKIIFMRDCLIYHFRERSITQSGKKWQYQIDSRKRLRHSRTNNNN